MNRGIIDKYSKIQTSKKVVTSGLLTTSAVLGVIGALTYYGSKVGNFVISVQGEYVEAISLSTKEDLSEPTDRLICETLPDILDADISYIPVDTIEEGLGNKNDDQKRYLAYSFYLFNAGNLDLNYKMSFSIDRVTRNLDSILRIMIIKDGNMNIYAKAREIEGYAGQPEPIVSMVKDNIIGYTTPFLINNNKGIVIEEVYPDLLVGDINKFTIVMWIDGWDSEQIDDMQGGAIETSLEFSVL